MSRLIHGGNNLASFRSLEEVVSKYGELGVTRLNGENLNIGGLKEAIETKAMLGERLVVVEDVSTTRSQTIWNELKEYFEKAPSTSNLIFFERRLLPPEHPLLGVVKKVETHPLPTGLNVFEWSDSVGRRDLGASLSGWQKLLEAGEEAEYLFLMLVRQFRLLLLSKRGERIKVPEFVERKIVSQTKLWTEEQLHTSYRELQAMDRENKSGQTGLEVSVVSFLISIGKVSV